jgi:hypothetical protein
MVFSCHRMRMSKSCTCEFHSEVIRILFWKILRDLIVEIIMAEHSSSTTVKCHHGFRGSYFSTELQCIIFYKWNTYISPHLLEAYQIVNICMICHGNSLLWSMLQALYNLVFWKLCVDINCCCYIFCSIKKYVSYCINVVLCLYLHTSSSVITSEEWSRIKKHQVRYPITVTEVCVEHITLVFFFFPLVTD